MTTKTKESITEAIVRLRDGWIEEHGYSCPCDINNGDCVMFAEEIVCLFPGAGAIWGNWVDQYLIDGSEHCVIEYAGKFYDSQCPEGVTSIKDIPFWKHRDICTCHL